jgi:hypothetical protein
MVLHWQNCQRTICTQHSFAVIASVSTLVAAAVISVAYVSEWTWYEVVQSSSILCECDIDLDILVVCVNVYMCVGINMFGKKVCVRKVMTRWRFSTVDKVVCDANGQLHAGSELHSAFSELLFVCGCSYRKVGSISISWLLKGFLNAYDMEPTPQQIQDLRTKFLQKLENEGAPDLGMVFI